MVTIQAVDLVLALMVLSICAGVTGFCAGVLWCELRQIDRCGPVEGVPDDSE